MDYFCKNHNQLCCPACITKIKGKGRGQHQECDVCFIEDIKNEKKNKLKQNISLLKELSKTLNDRIEKIKVSLDNINKNKEKLKMVIQSTFTKIRNELNNREDKLLIEVDEQFGKVFFYDNFINNFEKIPKKVKLSLEKSEKLEKEKYEDNQLINECITLENNIKEINILNENINKFKNSNNIEIIFSSEEYEINNFIEIIRKFGNINSLDLKQSMKNNSSILNKSNEQQESIKNGLMKK